MDKQFFLGFIGPISMDVYHVQSMNPYELNTDISNKFLRVSGPCQNLERDKKSTVNSNNALLTV